MNSVGQRLKHEVLDFLFPAIFFLLAFQLLALTRFLALREYGIRISIFIAAVVGALIVAKVVLLLDHVKFINRFPEKPLIYNVLWKTFLYAVAAFIVRYLEHLIHFWRQTGSLIEGNRRLVEEVVWPHFWMVQMWLVVLLLVFCSLRELSRALGPERVRRLFFTAPAGSIQEWAVLKGERGEQH